MIMSSAASKIIILDESIVSKIAAGEVVERPASVVKELVENAIDAGSKKIVVEVKGGGRKFIRITDDGFGMTKDEAALALERHSTSKIREEKDLYTITTLGFRGEALPSIASVSKLEISTKRKNTVGIILNTEGAKIKEIKEAGIPEGTTVIVRDLFYNTPARLKFLKSKTTEIGHIGNIISQFIFSHPEISFKLTSDGNELLSSPGNGSLFDSVACVYGADISKNLVSLDFTQDLITVNGTTVRSTISRIDRGYQSFFVNKRYVRNSLLSRALEEAFRDLIPKGRYPVAVIFINLPSSQVDVNVHPTKREVKFVNTQKVLDTVTSAVRSALSKGKKGQPKISESFYEKTLGPSSAEIDVFFREVMEPLKDESLASGWFPLAQLFNTYIVAIAGEALVLVDQHAAHERIIYDSLRGKRAVGAQNLLIPENIELPPALSMVLMEKIDVIRSYGFDIEHFGKDAFILRTVPAPLSKVSPKEVLIDMLTELKNLGKTTQLDQLEEKIRAVIACHGATRAGDKLEHAEMQSLLQQLSRTENPATCPHGRPTMIELSKVELEKMFKRK